MDDNDSIFMALAHIQSVRLVRCLCASLNRSLSLTEQIFMYVSGWIMCVCVLRSTQKDLNVFSGLCSQNYRKVYIVNVKRHWYTVCICLLLLLLLLLLVCFVLFFFIHFHHLENTCNAYARLNCWTEPNQPIRFQSDIHSTHWWPSREMWKTANKTAIFEILCSQLLFKLS